MKEILKKENKTTLIVSIICFVLIGIVATYTYSFFSVTKKDSAIIAGEAESLGLTVVVNQTAPTPSADLIPQMDEYITSAIVGRQGSCVDDNGNTVCHTYKITVTNANVKTKVNGTLTLDKKQNPNLKWAVYNLDGESVPSLVGNIKTPENKTLIKNEEFTAGETKEYYIVVWISESGMVQTDKGGYSGVIDFATSNGNVSVALDDSGANSPALTDGLIPVMYDEATSKWVKADILDNTSPYSWYDYTEKKWANAVLVKETTDFDVNVSVLNDESDKQVNIFNKGYISSCGMNDTPSDITFSFTTGATGGEFSFYYSSESESWKAIEILLNGNTIVEAAPKVSDEFGVNGIIPPTLYSTSLSPNTEYTMFISYNCGWFNGYLLINNLVLPDDLTSPLTVTSTGDYPWNNHISFIQSSSYTINEDYKFVLDNVINGRPSIGDYICSDGKASECDMLYQIKEVENEATVTLVDSYIIDVEVIVDETAPTRESLKNSEPGTEIPEDMILAQYVWVPRYKYKVWNKDKVIGVDAYNAQTTGIDIVFESGTSTTGDVRCTYNYGITATNTVRNEECTGTNGESYYTHPAFTFGEDELTGFWMGKYEISSDVQNCMNEGTDGSCSGGVTTSLTPRMIAGVMNWSGNTVANYSTVIKNMQINNNIYGLSTDLNVEDSHMITNMEWGAVSYLVNSDYGMCKDGVCNEMQINSQYYAYKTGITGSGGSSTGNIYGVYDLLGGAEEYVATGISSSNLGKYITTYAPSDFGMANVQEAYNRSLLGDAIGEVVSIDVREVDPEQYEAMGSWYYFSNYDNGLVNGWFNSYVNVPTNSISSISRGGSSGAGDAGYIFDVNSAANYLGEFYGTRGTLAVYQ